MSRFLETSQFLKELNALWDAHAVHIAKANTNLNTMLNTASKIPSSYISTLKKLTEAQDNLARSSSKLNSETSKQAKEIAALIAKRNALLANTKSLSSAMDALEAKLKKANSALATMTTNSNANTTAQAKHKAEIAKLTAEVDKLNSKLNSANIAVNRMGNSFLGSAKSMIQAFGISTGVYLFAEIIKNIYTTTKELQSLDLALKMVSGSQEEFASNQIFIKGVSEKWGIEIKGLTQQYTQFYTASKGILATEKIKDVFESIAKSGALMGLSVEKQNAAFYAFEQMMSKGVVASEELKKQLGNAMPGAMKAAGMAYMELHPKIKSIQEAEAALMKDMKAGAIDSATYVPLIVKNFEKLYGIEMVTKVDTLQASQERLMNSWTEMIRAMSVADQGTIAGQTLVGMTKVAAGFLNVLTNIISSQNMINANNRGKAAIKGSEAFASDVNDFGGKTDSTKKSYAHKQMAEDYKEAEYLVIKIQKLTSDLAGNRLTALFKFNTKAELAKANEALGYFNARIEAAKKIITPDTLNAAGVGSDTTGETDKQRKAREKAEKAAAKFREKENKDEYAAGLSSLEHEKFIIEQKMLLKDNSYSENIRLAMELGVKEQEIARYVYDEDIRLAGDSSNKKLIADNKYYKEKIKLAKEYLDTINKVEYKPQYKDKNKVADEEKYGSGVFETDKDTIKGMTDLWKEQQDEKDKIAKQEKERLLAMRDVLNDVFKEFGKATGFEKTMDMFGKIGKNGKTFWENLTGGKDGEIDLKEGLTAGLTITQDIGNKIANDSIDRYDRQRDLLEMQKEEAIKNAGDSASAKAAIEEEYERKNKEINRKQAITKKKQTLFNIGMDTAQALMALWVNPGFPAAIPMAIAVGALGAAQFAIAAGTSLPSYYIGTDNASEGFANTDEHGAELHLDKNNKIKDFGSNKGPRIKYLSEGDKIIPAAKTASLLSGNDFSMLDEILSLNNILYHENKNDKLDTSGIINSIDSLTDLISNKESSEEYYDVRGHTKYVKKNGQRIEDKNNRIRFKKSVL